MRPNWDDYFLNFARVASTRSTCPRAHCGAVVVVNNRIVATGYNGSAPGESHCDDPTGTHTDWHTPPTIGCLMEDGHCQRTLHAEVNALAQCARSGVSCDGGTLYIYFDNYGSSHPAPVPGCRECNKVIKAAGIARVVGLHNDGQQGEFLISEKITHPQP